jgi:hypothetical protein
MAVLPYGLVFFVRLTVLAITSKDGRFGALSGEGLARWRLLRFQPLPIQPCVKFSLTRLTDTVHRVACADAYRTVPASR